MSYDVKNTPGNAIVNTIQEWLNAYREQHIEFSHDQSMLTLMSPDEALLVVGPPRLYTYKDNAVWESTLSPVPTDTQFQVIGFVGNITYSETAQIQPLKAIGSRRHIFSKSNAPVQGSIGRMMILGSNLLRTLYSQTVTTDFGNSLTRVSGSGTAGSTWYTNLEEDIFRIPFGMGVIYSSPGTMNEAQVYAGDYFEACVLTQRSSTVQSGQALIMEQVSFMADRVLPGFVNSTLTNTSIAASGDIENPYTKI